MIIVDRALAEREAIGHPIEVGVVGAGFAGRGFVHQVTHSTPGMRVAVVANRTLERAARALCDLGVDAGEVVPVSSVADLERAIAAGRPAITDDPSLVCAAGPIEAVVETTGDVEHGAGVVLDAIDNGKHVITFGAELDGTLGPLLKRRADSAGIVYSGMEGDQPGVILNLAREVRMLGLEPVVLGNMKTLLDHRRNPTTQAGFAARFNQNPKPVASYADGTKIGAEMVALANATGFGALVRGMAGPSCEHVDEAAALFPVEELHQQGRGIVDYVLGAQPAFGVFVIAYGDSPFHQRYLQFSKMGDGPVYTFHRPFHLAPLEMPLGVARAVLFRDPTLAPLGAPVCELITVAKKDLRAGEVLDGIGGYGAYGLVENASTARAEDLLPMALSEGCRLRRDVPMDAAITFDDVDVPGGRLVDLLWKEQCTELSVVAS